MPQFYFHIRRSDGLIKDDEGIDLANSDEVKVEAIEAARCLLAEAAKMGRDARDDSFVVMDQQGREIMSVPFAEAFREDGPV
jgi:hypothetical protein